MSVMVGTMGAQRARVLAMVAVLAAAAIMVAGIAMAAGLLSTDGLTRPGPLGQSETTSSTHKIGDDVETSFGIVAVEYVRSLEGVSSRALAGASHGVAGLVDNQHAQIQAALAVTNRISKPLSFTVDQVHLRVQQRGRTTVLEPVTGDIPNTRVLSNAGIEGHLDFVVPKKGARFTLEFDDPARSEPVLINLGKIDFSPMGSGHEH